MRQRLLLVPTVLVALASGGSEAAAQHAHGAPAVPNAACEGVTGPTRQCPLDQYLVAVLHHDGIEAAIARLDSIAAADADVRREAHGYAHAIGIAAYTGTENVGEVFNRCTPAYQSGCYHGVIQSYFTHHAADPARIDADLVNSLCEAQRGSERGRWLLFQCAHGLGHGLTMVAGYHLPTALEWCDLVRDPWERESCYGGVFMENIVQATMPHHAAGRPQMAAAAAADHHHHGAGAPAEFPPLKADDPFHPCSAIDDRYHPACYQMQTSAILYFNRQDVAATARICASAPELYRGTCFQSLGRDISSITLQDHSRARRLCGTAPTDFEPWCHIGYAKNLIDVTADPADGFAYCQLLQEDVSKRACYVAVGEEIWVLEEAVEERERMCRAAEGEYVAACRHGAGLEMVAKPAESGGA